MYKEYFCWERTEKIRSFKHGLEKAMLSGTTCIAQVSKENKYFQILNNAPIKTYLFFELYADSRDAGKSEFRKISSKIEYFIKNKSDNMFIGVAPCSLSMVHKRLWKIISKYARKNNLLMLIRIAESQEEMDWLKHGFSDVDLLNEFTNNKKFEPIEVGLTPAQYLEQIGALSKQLIVSYGNYLPISDLELLNAQKVALAYCPRISDNLHEKKLSFDIVTQYFQNRFGFGLNSLAFNKDLSLLNELKYINNGQLDTLEAIKYLTIIPAKILRLNNIIGSLEVDKDADFNVFELNEGEDYNAILNKERPNHVYIKAKRVVKNSKMNI